MLEPIRKIQILRCFVVGVRRVRSPPHASTLDFSDRLLIVPVVKPNCIHHPHLSFYKQNSIGGMKSITKRALTERRTNIALHYCRGEIRGGGPNCVPESLTLYWKPSAKGLL